MYNQRFRQWNVSKYLKNAEKKVLLNESGGSVKGLTERFKAGVIGKAEYEKTLRWYRAKQQPSLPSRPVLMDERTVRTDLILGSLSNYHHSLHDMKANLDSRFLDLETSQESNDLWFGIIRGVKELAAANEKAAIEAANAGKSAASHQALVATEKTFSMLRQVGSLAAPAMVKRPLDFVYELLVELSSPRNKEWSGTRNVILELFNREASHIFGSEHPIAVICREMQNESSAAELASRSMECMQALALSLWGEESVLTFKTRQATHMTFLKARSMQKAAHVGTELLEASQKIWGFGSKQARMAQFRLGQLYLVANELAMATGKSDRAAIQNALQLYHDVILLPPSPSCSSSVPVTLYHEDETTLMALADIAFIHNRIGNNAEALGSYQKAAEMSRRICGPQSNVTKAAITELVAKLKEVGRDEQARSWEAILTAVMPNRRK